MSPRLKCAFASVALLVISPLLFKWSILDVLEKARAHDPSVSWTENSLFVIPLALFGGVAGLVMAAMPKVWVGFVPGQRRQFSDLSPGHKVLVVTAVVVIMGSGFALRSWLLSELEQLGYQV